MSAFPAASREGAGLLHLRAKVCRASEGESGMRRLTQTAAALAFGVLPAVGLVATVPTGGVLADGGVIHANKARSVHVLADGGVIHADAVVLADSAVRPADDGVITSRN